MMIDQPGEPGNPTTYRPRHNEVEFYDEAWNAVAIASTHFQQSRAALCHILARGQQHGLTLLELGAASGLSHECVVRMIDEADV